MELYPIMYCQCHDVGRMQHHDSAKQTIVWNADRGNDRKRIRLFDSATSPYTQQRRAEIYEERSVPTLYIRDIILEDENGNRAIDAGERCRFTFILCNEGNQTLKEIIPELKGKKQAKGIRCSEPIPIRNVKPGEVIRYRVNLIASPKLKSGEARYTIRLETGNRQDTYEETFDVPTIGR